MLQFQIAAPAVASGRPSPSIDIGTDELIRNDVLAAKYGVSERTLNRGGGPYVLIGGVKYRPHRQSNEHIAASVRRRNQPAATRPRRGARRRAV
jgi:hypothetical protein